MKKTVATLSVLLLTLTACGGGEDEETAKKNLRASFTENDTIGEATEEQANCMADGMVDELGVETLQEYKILDDDLKVNEDPGDVEMSEDDANKAADVVVGCVDVAEMITEQMASGDDSLTDEQAECIKDAIDEDVMRDMLAAEFQGKESDGMDEMTGALMKCVMGDLGQE